MHAPEPAIVVENVSKRYRAWRPFASRRNTRNAKLALNDVSFRVEQGETVALLGPNGAGKTTLLKILATLLYVSSGRVLIHGCDVQTDPIGARRMIGLVTSDERSFYWRLTGRQNLTFFAALFGLPRRTIAARVASLLDATDLTDAADRPFHAYSSGMKQRLAIARGFLADPRIVLYDEPTRSLDPLTASRIRSWIVRSRTISPLTTHLIATNQLAEAEALCDRALIINRGSAVASGTFDQIRQRWHRDDCTVHQITYRGPVVDRRYLPDASGLLDISDQSRGENHVLRVSAVEGTDVLSLTLAAIIRTGATVVRCEAEQVSFDAVFCTLVDHTSAATTEAAYAEAV
jgi:ABC-2 type transport system ATP-binding protein